MKLWLCCMQRNLCETGSVLFCACSLPVPGMCTWSSALHSQAGLGRNHAAQCWEEQGRVCVPLMQLGLIPRNAFLNSVMKKGAFSSSIFVSPCY